MKTMIRGFLLLLLMCSVAFADNGPVMTVFDDVVHLAAYTLALTLAALLTMAVNKIRQKWHVEVPGAWIDSVNKLIDQAIHYAEEQAHKAANESEVSSNEKLNMAAKFLLTIAGDDKRLVAMGEEKIKQLIEARLGQTRSTSFAAAVAVTPGVGDTNA